MLRSDRRCDDLYAGEARKCAWNAQRLASDISNSKKLDAPQRFTLRITHEETIHSFCVTLIAAAPVCFAQVSLAKPAKSTSNQTAITNLKNLHGNRTRTNKLMRSGSLCRKITTARMPRGLRILDREVADMAKADLRDYSLADMKVVFPSADVAVITYKATIQQTSEGKDMSGTFNSGSIWVKKGGKWLEVFHTEAKAQ